MIPSDQAGLDKSKELAERNIANGDWGDEVTPPGGSEPITPEEWAEKSSEESLAHFGIKGMRWGIRKEKGEAFARARTFGQPYSHDVGIGHGSKIFTLSKPEKLRVEVRDGVVDVRPIDGFRSKRAERFHDEVLQGIEEMRKEYPALRDMKIEITPMSHQPGGRWMLWSGIPAAAAHLKEGEARLFYNDRMRGNPDKLSSEAKKMQPGLQEPGFLGRHEAGHILAMAGGQMPSGWGPTHSGDYRQVEAQTEQINQLHRDLFKKHGLSFGEMSALSPYAATEPAEAMAELAAYYHTPKLRSQMSPAMQTKAKALLDDVGGKKR